MREREKEQYERVRKKKKKEMEWRAMNEEEKRGAIASYLRDLD